MESPTQESGPLSGLGEWDDFVKTRYQEGRGKDEFRQYTAASHPSVLEFYRQNHRYQTLDTVLAKKKDFLRLNRRRMGIWEALEYLNTLVDDSDPDTDLSQIDHAVQTAEACRKDGRPRWFILTGLIHDLGKVLCLYGEPQWAVVGDTFPVGCRFSDRIVYPEFFHENPDSKDPSRNTLLGVYKADCGLDSVHLSWGHDEYLYQVVKHHLPEEALYSIRYHSFYPWHREGAYDHLCNGQDREMLHWVKEFNPYDLYSKGDSKPDLEKIGPFYRDLIAEYFPAVLNW